MTIGYKEAKWIDIIPVDCFKNMNTVYLYTITCVITKLFVTGRLLLLLDQRLDIYFNWNFILPLFCRLKISTSILNYLLMKMDFLLPPWRPRDQTARSSSCLKLTWCTDIWPEWKRNSPRKCDISRFLIENNQILWLYVNTIVIRFHLLI